MSEGIEWRQHERNNEVARRWANMLPERRIKRTEKEINEGNKSKHEATIAP